MGGGSWRREGNACGWWFIADCDAEVECVNLYVDIREDDMGRRDDPCEMDKVVTC